jgi:hypothetical protein
MKQGAGRGQKEIRRPALLSGCHDMHDTTPGWMRQQSRLRFIYGAMLGDRTMLRACCDLRSCHAGGSHDHPYPGEERKAGCAPGQGNKSLTASRP